MADCNFPPLKTVRKQECFQSKSRRRWLKKVRNMGPMIAMVTFCCDLHFDKNIMKDCDDYKHIENTPFPYPAGVIGRRACDFDEVEQENEAKQDQEIEYEADSLIVGEKEESAKSTKIKAQTKVSKMKTRNSSRCDIRVENVSKAKATRRPITKKKTITPLKSSSNVIGAKSKETRNKIINKNYVRVSNRKKKVLETISNNSDLKSKRLSKANSKLKHEHTYGDKKMQQSTNVCRNTKVTNEPKVVTEKKKKHDVVGLTDKKKANSSPTSRTRVADDRNSVGAENKEDVDKTSDNTSTFKESENLEYKLGLLDIDIKNDYYSENEDVMPKLEIKFVRSLDFKSFKCTFEDCTASFTQKANLKKHMRTHTGERPYKCLYNGCTATFTQSCYLLCHKRKHTGEKPFKCQWPQCKASFAQSAHLFIHKRIHSDARPYKCDLLGCKAAFKQAAHLAKHKFTHSGEKPFKCDLCSSTFASSYHMRLHKRIHTGEKPYGCEFSGCSAAFADLSNYIVHKRIHTGEKPFKCKYPGCSSAFAQSSGLTIHKRIHTNEKPYKCHYMGCRAMFAAGSGLYHHTKKYNHGV